MWLLIIPTAALSLHQAPKLTYKRNKNNIIEWKCWEELEALSHALPAHGLSVWSRRSSQVLKSGKLKEGDKRHWYFPQLCVPMLDFVLHITKALSAVARSTWDKKLVHGVVYRLQCDVARGRALSFLPFLPVLTLLLQLQKLLQSANRAISCWSQKACQTSLFSMAVMPASPLVPTTSQLLVSAFLSFLFCVWCNDMVQEAAAQIQRNLGIDAHKQCWLSNDWNCLLCNFQR